MNQYRQTMIGIPAERSLPFREHFSTVQAAMYMGMTPDGVLFLQRLGLGPVRVARKPGRRAHYTRHALDAYMAERNRQHREAA